MERRRRSIRIHKKLLDREQNIPEPSSMDRLSVLPDEVICHILSFLPTKLSVSTSALAKRWRFVWAHVPSLYFHQYDFKDRKAQHSDIINRVMMLYEAKIIDTVRLSYVNRSPYQLESWIVYAVQRSVRNLYLDFDFKYGDCKFRIVCTLPRRLLTCKTLVDLKLDCCKGITSTGEVSLPSLRKLHLKYVEYEDDESLPHLLSGCHVLEDLIIDYCFREGQKNTGVVVSSPTLKTLSLDFSNGCPEEDDFVEMFIINVPALTYLKLNCCDLYSTKSLRKTMTSLIQAEIVLDGHWNKCGISCTDHAPDIEFLSCLCHVKCLKMSSPFDETLVDIVGHDSRIKFDNLTKLELDLHVDWYYLVKFLDVADNLEILTFNLSWMPPYRELERVPTCMTSRLRTVIIKYFICGDDGSDVVRYILRYAEVLERMEIYPLYSGTPDKTNLDALRRISLFERGSKLCQVAFNSD